MDYKALRAMAEAATTTDEALQAAADAALESGDITSDEHADIENLIEMAAEGRERDARR